MPKGKNFDTPLIGNLVVQKGTDRFEKYTTEVSDTLALDLRTKIWMRRDEEKTSLYLVPKAIGCR